MAICDYCGDTVPPGQGIDSPANSAHIFCDRGCQTQYELHGPMDEE